MKYFLRVVAPLLVVLAVVNGCNNTGDKSPYAQILEEPPYHLITDSIHKEPRRDELYFRRAVLLNSNSLAEPALADFRKAWSLKKDERYAFGISKILVEQKSDSAILFLKEAMKELPQSVLLMINLAHAYADQSRDEDALKTCDIILKLDPRQINTLILKAGLLVKKGDLEGSITALEQAYILDPKDPSLSHELAFRYAQAKNPKTLAFCDSLIARDPGQHAEPYYFKGVYYSNRNDKANALLYFDKAIQHDYNFLDAHMDRGELLFDDKKIGQALKAFSLVTTIDPTFADGYYWMGKCQEALGEKDEALANYQRAYGLDKTLIEAKEAAKKIKG